MNSINNKDLMTHFCLFVLLLFIINYNKCTWQMSMGQFKDTLKDLLIKPTLKSVVILL